MSRIDAELGALIGSRLCHDLISPIGAIANGVELIMLADSVPSTEMHLVSESVEDANARLRLFRIAFGMASAEQNIAPDDLRAIFGYMNPRARHRVEWHGDAAIPRPAARLALLLIFCMESALPRGGRITAGFQGAGFRAVCEDDPLVAYDSALWDRVLTGDGDPREVTPAQVHFPLAGALAAEAGLRVEVDRTDGGLAVSF